MQDPQNNTEKKEKSGVRTAGAISFVFLLTLFAKLLCVVREMMQANIFGTGIDADLYTASYNSTLYLFTTMCYALCIAAVPILTKEFAADRKREPSSVMVNRLLAAFSPRLRSAANSFVRIGTAAMHSA